MYGYNQQFNLDRINNQIQELQRLKESYQNMPQQQPITNIINTTSNQNDFKAVILKENEKPEEILVTSKTMFFDDINGVLYIKEINGDIKKYEVVIPKTKEQLENEDLKNKLKEMEKKINELSNTTKFNEPNQKNENNKYNESRATKGNE